MLEEASTREYTDTDRQFIIDAICDLQEIERKLTDTRRPGPEIAEAYLKQLKEEVAEKAGAIFVAKIGNRFAGFVACWVEHDNNIAETPESTTFGYISDAYVAPEFRGKGIFKQLDARAEAYLSSFPEVRLVRITVLARNESALKAYEHTGYEPEEISLVKKIRNDPNK